MVYDDDDRSSTSVQELAHFLIDAVHDVTAMDDRVVLGGDPSLVVEDGDREELDVWQRPLSQETVEPRGGQQERLEVGDSWPGDITVSMRADRPKDVALTDSASQACAN